MKRKILMPIFGIFLMVAIVFALELSQTIQLDEDTSEYYNQTCIDLGYPNTLQGMEECVGEESEDILKQTQVNDLTATVHEYTEKLITKEKFHKAFVDWGETLKANSDYYQCEEAPDMVDKEVCMYVENNGQECYYCEAKVARCMEWCENSVWTLI